MSDDIARAAALGKAAFLAGRKSVPCHDAALMAFFNDIRNREGALTLGSARMIRLLDAWSSAWHKENLA